MRKKRERALSKGDNDGALELEAESNNSVRSPSVCVDDFDGVAELLGRGA